MSGISIEPGDIRTVGVTDSAAILNIPMARKVLEHLIAHPEEHRQNDFGCQTACGTTMCIAGTTVWLNPDGKFMWQGANMVDLTGETGGIEAQAKEFLGLSDDDAQDLFFTFNNAHALSKLAAHIKSAERVQR